MKPNCLSRALDQWNEDREGYRLWYNSDHVIALQSEYEGSDLSLLRYGVLEYAPLSDFGYGYFLSAFKIERDKIYCDLLSDYLDQE